MPAAYQNYTAQVLVQKEPNPDTDDSKACGEPQKTGDAYAYEPLNRDSYDYRIHDIAYASQCAAGEYVVHSANLKYDVYCENCRACAYYLLVLRQERQ